MLEAESVGMGLKLLYRNCTAIAHEHAGGRNRLTSRFAIGATLDRRRNASNLSKTARSHFRRISGCILAGLIIFTALQNGIIIPHLQQLWRGVANAAHEMYKSFENRFLKQRGCVKI